MAKLSVGTDTLGYVGGAVGDFFDSAALGQSAESLFKASEMTSDTRKLNRASTNLKLSAYKRLAYKTIGGQQADVAGGGFSASGSALDLLRDSESEAAIDQALVSTQGAIEDSVLRQQKQMYEDQARAAQSQAEGAFVSGILKVVMAGASLAI